MLKKKRRVFIDPERNQVLAVSVLTADPILIAAAVIPAVILLILVSSVATPILLKKLYPKEESKPST